jgi:hypothetical protein
MKKYSLVAKLVVSGALVCCTVGLSQSSSYGQARTLTTEQIDAIVKPSLEKCVVTPSAQVRVEGQNKVARLDTNSIIPTASTRAFPVNRIARSLNGMWRGQVIGSPLDAKYEKSKEGNVDYFWIIDTARNEGLIIALRNGNNSTAGLALAEANPPKISYLICAHEGYIPTVEKGSEIHEFTKVSNSVADAPRILERATGVKFGTRRATLSDLWKGIVASGYFKSLPAVAFAGALFKPMRFQLVPSAIGPAQFSMSWDAEYYGGGTTWIRFTPGVPMKGVENTQFVGTTATAGDYLVASPGNGKLAKVEALSGGNYDLAFDSVSFGPLQSTSSVQPGRLRSNHGRRSTRPKRR